MQSGVSQAISSTSWLTFNQKESQLHVGKDSVLCRGFVYPA